MRIGIDISSATPGRTGIGTYTWEVTRRMIRDARHEWVLLFNSLRQAPPDWPELGAAHVRLIRRRVPGPALLYGWKWFDFPEVERLAEGAVDLFHSPATYIPPQRGGLRVTTVHDLHFRAAGAERARLAGKYLDWVVENRLGAMDLILTVSPAVGREVSGVLEKRSGAGERAAAVLPIPLGVDEHFFSVPSEDEFRRVRERYELPEKFLLHVGGWGSRKNVDALIKAFGAARSARDLPTEMKLVITGAGPPRGAGALPEFVRNVGFVPQDDVVALYRLARGLVFPSVYEGFGLPVLEAMACGCPVLTSRQVAVTELLPEEAVMLCDGDNVESIQRMLARAFSDEKMMDEMGARGAEIARGFSWDATAERTLRAYEELEKGR